MRRKLDFPLPGREAGLGREPQSASLEAHGGDYSGTRLGNLSRHRRRSLGRVHGDSGVDYSPSELGVEVAPRPRRYDLVQVNEAFQEYRPAEFQPSYREGL